MEIVFFGVGTNLGNRETNLEQAVAQIEKYIGKVRRSSSVYETDPWGFRSDDAFLNIVVEVGTDLEPQELLAVILNIESSMGRVRNSQQYSSRVIDIDILLYNDLVTDTPDLKIPHPRLHERKFVLIPLCEIAADMIHPVFKKTFRELLDVCEDRSNVAPLPPCPPKGG
jgi:2-amino-4-hydroxy-6-hydroxymethyldihydropteridine diphosphokinase